MARGPGHPVFNAQTETARDGIGGVRDVAQKGQLAAFFLRSLTWILLKPCRANLTKEATASYGAVCPK